MSKIKSFLDHKNFQSFHLINFKCFLLNTWNWNWFLIVVIEGISSSSSMCIQNKLDFDWCIDSKRAELWHISQGGRSCPLQCTSPCLGPKAMSLHGSVWMQRRILLSIHAGISSKFISDKEFRIYIFIFNIFIYN